MSERFLVRRDTPAWTMQVWISFALAICACTIGVWNMPSQDLDRAFLVIGLFFCLFATLTLAKMVRDNRDEKMDTAAWVLTVWVGFLVAFVLTAWGLYRMRIGSWERGYMIVAWLFLVSSAFMLAKTVRDKQEADVMEVASGLEPQAVPKTDAK